MSSPPRAARAMAKMVTLRSSDDEEFKVEETAAALMQSMKILYDDQFTEVVIRLPNITATILAKIVEYCKKHSNAANSRRHLRNWDAEFINVDQATLYHLIKGAHFLGVERLFHLCCKKVAQMIHQRTADEIREIFGIAADYTSEEEKAERKKVVEEEETMDDALARVAGKRRQREEASSQSRRTIPDTVVYYEILPRLSFKTLSRLTGVCKDWHAFIAGKSCEPSSSSCCSSSSSSLSLALASEQSRRPSAASVAFVMLSASGRLRFLPPAAPVAVPDPSLSFIPLRKWRRRRIAASAGGLLCLHLTRGGEDVLYVVNPATKQGQVVPPSGNRLYYAVGLAFDPSNSPNRYHLVRPRGREPRVHHSRQWITANYRFDVFSSETGRWVESRQQVRLRRACHFAMKSVYAQGIVYWRCHSSVLWYDPARDRAGAFALPKKSRGTLLFLDDIGVHEGGQLSCTRLGEEALELWLCAPPCGPWQKVHEKTWGEMIPASADAFGPCNTTTSCPAELQVWRPRAWLASSLRSLCFVREEKKLYLGVKATKTRSGERVVCYDITTGEAVDTGKVVRRWNPDGWTSSYHNSMVALPKIGGQSSVDEKSICEGSSEI